MTNKKAFLSLLLLIAGVNTASAGPTDDQIRQSRDINSQEQMRQLEREKALRQQQEIKPDARDALDTLKVQPESTDIIPDSETPCFVINEIVLVGEDAAKFKFALNAALDQGRQNKNTNKRASVLGSCLGAVGINAIMVRIQNAIISKGFVTTRVLTAPQDLKSGRLEFTVISGRIGAIRFTPDSSRFVTALNAFPSESGDLLNLRDIEQALENFKRVPTADADIQITPATATTEPGYSDILINYKRQFPLRVSISLDDSGYKTTGKYMGGVTLSGDSLLSLNDLFYVSHNHDLGGGEPGKRGTKGYTFHYSIPWDYWLLSTTTSSNEYHQEVAGASQNYIYSGTSQNAEIKLNRLVYRNSINKTNLSMRGFLRKSSNYIDDTEIEVQQRRTAGWELGFNQSWYLGRAILDYNLAYVLMTNHIHLLISPHREDSISKAIEQQGTDHNN